MATSPNYGWSEPDNTSLVKDGALAMRTLGDAIDTSVWNVGFGQAGKNKIINGDFSINQRNITSTTAGNVYLLDRWLQGQAGGVCTNSVQTFTPGAAPVAGYEGKNYLEMAITGQSAAGDFVQMQQRIEDVRTLAGQTVTFSFWAKAASGTPKIALEFQQYFGSGGSPSATLSTYAGQVTISTSWLRYSVTVTVPTISGKTLGTNQDSWVRATFWLSAGSNFDARTNSMGIQNATISLWGVQVEAGSKATPFQTASGGSLQGELAMCQRYFWNPLSGNALANLPVGSAFPQSTTVGRVVMKFPVTMRSAPSYSFGTIGNWSLGYPGSSALTSTTAEFNTSEQAQFVVETTGLTATQVYQLYRTNTTDTLLFSAEL
jgi:hypothetical protein